MTDTTKPDSVTDALPSQTPYKRAQAIAEMLHETPPVSQTYHALVQALGEELAELDSLRAMTCGLGDELAELDTLRAQLAEPIDMVLHCPACGMQHIDAVEELPVPMPGSSFEGSAGWTNPPHRSHLCHGCGHIWRPADVPTNGVEAVKTCGKADSKLAAPTDTLRAQLAEAQRDAERLDWIEQNANVGVVINRLKHITDLSRLVYEVAVDDVYATEDTLRAAIDAAKGDAP